MIKRTVNCGVCGREYTEVNEGEGWPGWGQLMGIVFNGEPNPHLCPRHLGLVAKQIDTLRSVKHGMD